MLSFRLTVSFTSTDYMTAGFQRGLDGLILAIGRENVLNFEVSGGATQSTAIKGVQVVSESRDSLPLQMSPRVIGAVHNKPQDMRRVSEMEKKWESAIISSASMNVKKIVDALVRCKTLTGDEIVKQTGIENLVSAGNTLGYISKTCNRLGIKIPYKTVEKQVKGKKVRQWTWIGFDANGVAP